MRNLKVIGLFILAIMCFPNFSLAEDPPVESPGVGVGEIDAVMGEADQYSGAWSETEFWFYVDSAKKGYPGMETIPLPGAGDKDGGGGGLPCEEESRALYEASKAYAAIAISDDGETTFNEKQFTSEIIAAGYIHALGNKSVTGGTKLGDVSKKSLAYDDLLEAMFAYENCMENSGAGGAVTY